MYRYAFICVSIVIVCAVHKSHFFDIIEVVYPGRTGRSHHIGHLSYSAGDT